VRKGEASALGQDRIQLWGERLAQQGLVHLFRGFSPKEGGKVGGRAASGEPLRCSKILGGGREQDGAPVLVFCDLDCLKIP